MGAAIVSLDAMVPPESWRWAGPDWEQRVHTDVTTAVAEVELAVDDPGAVAARWSAVLGRPARPAEGGWRIDCDGTAARFVATPPGAAESLAAVGVRAVDAESARDRARARGLVDAEGGVLIGGVRFELLAG
jgi:hypothetical protein